MRHTVSRKQIIFILAIVIWEERMKNKIISVGGGASNILSGISKQIKAIDFCDLIDINTDSRFLRDPKVIRFVKIGDQSVDNGTRGDSEKGRQALEFSYEVSNRLIKSTDHVIVISCFGGGTGSGVTPEIVKLLKQYNISVDVIVCMPLTIERPNQSTARDALHNLKNEIDPWRIIDIEKIAQKNSYKISLKDLFELVDEKVFELIKGSQFLSTLTNR